MRLWLSAATVALLCLCAGACGQGQSGTTSSTKAHAAAAPGVTLPQPEFKADAELDSDSYPGEADNDNNHVFGRAAGAADRRAATALVERYYAAAAAGDGARACALMYSTFAESVPEDYGPAPGTSSARAETCAVAASKLFGRLHGRLRSDLATLRVVAVRVRRREASALLRFGGKRKLYYLALRLERGAWKISRLLAGEDAIYVE